ncbi:putative lysine decarboxylase family protein [Candidatus Endolissoclinum faulkneri L2]|uniref:Cytokinin riboside 5'-monophosphate phosphoribohydrolase n=1 Tax=Candidatus Endolissoclinum faulkneri L2 TaxID=1193729 RepID=K7YNG9_9PROT|nr:TIGR00730 family Rossman fold protein [Candidatus Endolissoclinum faulkneri]AFX99062.1 putative lysine decarboxylase family protein [Candidatus Endolissoclinum faulkneri L2]
MSNSLSQSICVFCGSSSEVDELYKKAAQEIGCVIGVRGYTLIYGGGRLGLMGIVADATLAAGGKVIGVITKVLQNLQISHARYDKLLVTDSMHERKRLMYDLADAFIILPGGLGTMDETMEVLVWLQLKLLDKPLVMLDINDFWRPMFALIDHTIAAGFTSEENRNLYKAVSTTSEVFDVIGNWSAQEK